MSIPSWFECKYVSIPFFIAICEELGLIKRIKWDREVRETLKLQSSQLGKKDSCNEYIFMAQISLWSTNTGVKNILQISLFLSHFHKYYIVLIPLGLLIHEFSNFLKSLQV